MSDIDTANQRHTLRLGCDAAEVTRLNGWIDDLQAELKIDKAPLEDLRLCVNEAVANAITHGGDGLDAIDVSAWSDGTTLYFEVRDTGRAFDPTAAPERTAASDLESETIGGWGIPLMRRLSDDMRYKNVGGQNRVRFEKALRS